MTDYTNAEILRAHYLQDKRRKNVINICQAIPNWNGCDYCDVYAGKGFECWKQSAKHNCCKCEEVESKTGDIKP